MAIKRRFSITPVVTASGKTVGVVTSQPTAVRPSTFPVAHFDRTIREFVTVR